MDGVLTPLPRYAGKLQIIERQIHHYGSGLNALVLLSAFRDNPSDSYLLRVGYGGTSGALSNIHDNGFAACAMHAWPEHLAWDGYSGDYGPNFVGMALGSGVYLTFDAEIGELVAYGGIMRRDGANISVQVRDPTRQKVFIGPLNMYIRVDAGAIESFTYNVDTKTLSLVLGQVPVANAPAVDSVILWASTGSKAGTGNGVAFKLTLDKGVATPKRGGTRISLTSGPVTVSIAME